MHKPCSLLLCLVILFSLSLGCSKKVRPASEPAYKIPITYVVSVAPFTQPTNPSELILGRIPDDQGLITPEDMMVLDRELKTILLENSKRHFVFLAAPLESPSTSYHNSAQPQALNAWLEYGKKHNAQLLLVPQVLNWHERDGSRAGVTKSAEVRVEFFLLRMSNGSVVSRSIYDEKQQALTENLLKIGDFIKRGAAWVSATDLAKEGMTKAKKEIGL